MGRDKQKRANRSRDADRRPASSDTADLDSASAASKAQRDDYDESGRELEDQRAHIIAAFRSNAGNEIVINRGSDDGVVVGMFGHVLDGDGVLGELTVTEVRAANCTAKTSGIDYAAIQNHKDVVLNPSNG